MGRPVEENPQFEDWSQAYDDVIAAKEAWDAADPLDKAEAESSYRLAVEAYRKANDALLPV
jgi:hypothetical protein